MDEKDSEKDTSGLNGTEGKGCFGIKKEDLKGIIIVTFLYFLQGIPLGLFGCLFLILNDEGIGYSDMAILSIAIYPFRYQIT